MAKKITDDRRIVSIDLSVGEVEIGSLPEILKSKGGRYLTSRAISDEVNPNVHPLEPENNLYIAPGFLSGTTCPNSGRTSIGAKSPLTGGIKETNVGGNLASYLAKLGIAMIKITGKSSSNNLIVFEEKDGEISVSQKKMDRITGKETYETSRILQDEFGDSSCVTSIGPAGEKGYLTSCICVTDIDGKPTRQAGRGGIGAVMGSKGIKAIVISNPKKTKISFVDHEKFKNNVSEFRDILKKNQKSPQRPCQNTGLT